MADFQDILRAFLSPDNTVRRDAVRALELLQSRKDELPIGLLQVIRVSAAPELRMLAAVLFRKVINTEDSSEIAQWTRIEPVAQTTICEQLLLAVQQEPEDFVRRRVCDTLAEVALHVLADAPWPKLWLSIYALVASPAYPLQEAGLLLCEMLGGHIAGSMTEHLPSFRSMYHQRLSEAAAPRRVRAAAARAIGSVLISLASKSTSADTFAALIPDLIRCLLEAQAARDTEMAMVFVGIIVDIADQQAQLFKPCLADVVRALCGLSSDATGDNDVRRVSMEAVLCIAENAPSIARKGMPGGGFLAVALPVALRMMLEHGTTGTLSDIEWDALDGRLDGSEDAGDDSSNVGVGEEAIDRLGQAIGAEHLNRAITPMITAALSTPAAADGSEWKYHFAGLSALSETADMLPEDDDVAVHTLLVTQIAPFIRSRHRRVRHAALGALAAFCHYKDPVFQLHTHAIVVPLIILGLQDVESRRVRAQAAIAVQDYAGTLAADTDEELLRPYLPSLLGALFSLITPADLWITEKALSAVSALADSSGQLIIPYYDVIMPGVRQLLSMPDECVAPGGGGSAGKRGAQRRALLARVVKGRCLECLSTVGLAAGAERFHDDALVALHGIVGLLAASSRGSGGAGGSGSPLTAVSGDDPVLMYLWEAVRRIARAVGVEAFSPFIPAVVPPLLVAARAETIVTTIKFGQKNDLDAVNDAATGRSDAELSDDDDDEDFVHSETGYAAMIKVKTSALEEKHSAIWALGAIAGFVRGPAHAHFAVDILSALLPCLTLAGAPFDDIREAAAASIGDCLISAASALSAIDVMRAANGAALPSATAAMAHASATNFIYMLSTSLLALAKAAVADDHIELIKTLVTCVSHVMRDSLRRSNFFDAAAAEAVGCPILLPLLSQDVLRELTQLMLQVRQASINRRAVRAAEMVVNADDVDEEEAEANKEKDKDEWTLQHYVADSFGAMLRTHGGMYMPIFSALVHPVIMDMAHPDVLSTDRCLALFVIDDVLEYVGESSAPGCIAEYVSVLLRCAVEPTPITAQAAVYGLGASSLTCRSAMLKVLPAVLNALSGATVSVASRKEPAVIDNAVTALAKIIYHIYDGAGSGQHPDTAPVAAEQLRAIGAPSRRDLMKVFTGRLPLRHDDEEFRVALQLLCTWMDAGDADLVEVGGLPHLLDVMAVGLLDRNVVTDELRDRVRTTLVCLKARCSAAVEAAFTTLSPAAQLALSKIAV